MDNEKYKEIEKLQHDTENLRNQSILIGVGIVGEYFTKLEQQNYTKKQVLTLIRLIGAIHHGDTVHKRIDISKDKN